MVDEFPFVLYTVWYSHSRECVVLGAGTIYETHHGPVRWYEQPTLGM